MHEIKYKTPVSAQLISHDSDTDLLHGVCEIAGAVQKSCRDSIAYAS